MSLFGINATANLATSATQSSVDPSVTLRPSQFEDAISQIAAQYIWAGEFAILWPVSAIPHGAQSGSFDSFQLVIPAATLDPHTDSVRALLQTS